MERKNELYLLILSIILGISVLKLPEMFQLGHQIKDLYSSLTTTGLSIPVVGVFLFVSGYLIFFILVALASYGIVLQLGNKDDEKLNDLGPLVGLCVVVLAVSYLSVFAVVVSSVISK